MHTMLDYKGTIPSLMVVTPGKDSDIKVAKQSNLPLCPDSILVADRAYVDTTTAAILKRIARIFWGVERTIVRRANNNYSCF